MASTYGATVETANLTDVYTHQYGLGNYAPGNVSPVTQALTYSDSACSSTTGNNVEVLIEIEGLPSSTTAVLAKRGVFDFTDMHCGVATPFR